MFRIVLLLGLVLASPLQALSCLRPDVVDLYERARDSADTYSIARGRVMLDGPLARPPENSDAIAETRGRFVGIALSADGFDQVYLRDIIVETSCLSVWCGSLAEGELVVALRHEDSERRLRIGPCGGDHIAVTPEDERRLLACHRSGLCQRAE